jgi:hypothetical protein
MRNIIADLTPASGRQDHTAWPSAERRSKKPSGGFGTSPRALRSKAVQCHSSIDTAASIASRTNVRDDRETPLSVGRDAMFMTLIWGKRKAKYFSAKDWTTQIMLIGLKKLT